MPDNWKGAYSLDQFCPVFLSIFSLFLIRNTQDRDDEELPLVSYRILKKDYLVGWGISPEERTSVKCPFHGDLSLLQSVCRNSSIINLFYT